MLGSSNCCWCYKLLRRCFLFAIVYDTNIWTCPGTREMRCARTPEYRTSSLAVEHDQRTIPLSLPHKSKHRGSGVRALALGLPNLLCFASKSMDLIFDVNEMEYFSASPISFTEILPIPTAAGDCLHSPRRCQCLYG